MARRDKKSRLRVLVPSGGAMVRMYHRNIVANQKALETPTIQVPSIVTRAKLVVRESREIITKEYREE